MSTAQEAGIPSKLARSIGIAVDHRRRNRSLESLQVGGAGLPSTTSVAGAKCVEACLAC